MAGIGDFDFDFATPRRSFCCDAAPKPPPLGTRPAAGRRPPSGGAALSAAHQLRPPSAGSARSGASRPASLNWVSTASSTPTGAQARPWPSAGAPMPQARSPFAAAPPKAAHARGKERRDSFEQKLEKRDMLVKCILNDDLPNRSVTPSGKRQQQHPAPAPVHVRRSSQGTTRGPARAGTRGPARAGSRSRSMPPDNEDGSPMCWSGSAEKGRPARIDNVDDAFRFGGSAADWQMEPERVAPLNLPSLRLGMRPLARPQQHRAYYGAYCAASPTSGSQSARNWRRQSAGL